MTIENLGRPEHLTPYLQHIGALHVRLAVEHGFSSDLWRVFRDAIYTTMKQRIDSAQLFNEQLPHEPDRHAALDAWTNMSMLIVQTMHQGYAEGIRQLRTNGGCTRSSTAKAAEQTHLRSRSLSHKATTTTLGSEAK